MEITIIHTLSPETLAALKGLSNGHVEPPAKKTKKAPVSRPAETEAPAKKVTEEEVRAAIGAKATDHAEAVVELLKSFGTNNIKGLDPEHYAEAVAKAEAL